MDNEYTGMEESQNISVSDYAKSRDVSPQTVYNHLKKLELETVRGVSEGKAAKLLTPDTQFQLDQVLKPTKQSQTTLQKLVVAQDGIIKAQRESIDALKGFITAERETRDKFLARADGISAEVKDVSAEVIQKAVEDAFEKSINWDKQQQKFQKQMAEKDKIIEEKDALIKAQREEIEKLKGLLSEAVQHPYKHLFSVASHVEAYKPYEKEKNNGKS
jgi:DNA repair exonuclease SbcCD ATPase subunit